MSLNDLAHRLEQSFQTSTRLLQQLLRGLLQRRTAWISALPDTVEPAAELNDIASDLASEDLARTALVGQLSKLLPLEPGVTADDLHVDVTRIGAAIPPASARSLRHAADEATAVAKKVRRELALGRRLLGFGQRTNESLMAEMAVATRPNNARSYDRSAQACRGLGNVGASLIDGRM